MEKKYFIFILFISCFQSCDSITYNLGSGFEIFEHDVSSTRRITYNSQAVISIMPCSVGFNKYYIWAELCQNYEHFGKYLLIEKEVYSESPIHFNSYGLTIFENYDELLEELRRQNINPKYKYNF